MAKKEIVDVHCHYFNVKFALMEFAAITWNYIRGKYPRRKKSEPLKNDQAKSIREIADLKRLIRYVVNLIDTATDSSIDQCDSETDAILRSFADFGDVNVIVAPLMMDIYFALDDNRSEEAGKADGTIDYPLFEIEEREKEEFVAHLSAVERELENEITATKASPEKQAMMKKTLSSTLAGIAELMLVKDAVCKSRGYEMSPGFRYQLDTLKELIDSLAEQTVQGPVVTVMPFLAVDPRRKGIMELIKEYVNEGKGHFKGIKLYPSLGYLPTHRNLQEVYAYCSKHHVPITVHCMGHGVENGNKKIFVSSWLDNQGPGWMSFAADDAICQYFSDPKNWEGVFKVEDWQNALRVNFAHFGGNDEKEISKAWRKKIASLMTDRNNVFADISSWVNPVFWGEIGELIKDKPILQERLMFGTDYVIVITHPELDGDLKNYFDQYVYLNSAFLSGNARNFLNLPGHV